MKTLDFWFDYSCPYAYVASTQVEALAARTGATLRWRPMLLGGVFRAVQTAQNLAQSLPPPKVRYLAIDQARHADRAGVPLHHPMEHPRRTVEALRATLARGCDPAIIHAFFRAYWVEGRAIEDVAVVKEIAGDVDREAQREPLRIATEEAVSLGIFGAPAYLVDGQLWWGQDRQHFVERALGGTPPPPSTRRGTATMDFWFDYSSPFAYLASTQIPAIEARTGATIRWRPMLLGALFKAVGQADVPLFAMNEAKRNWFVRDVGEWAAWWGVPFHFNPFFPIRTLLPLRVTFLHPDPVAFAQRVYRAAWVEGLNVADAAVLRDLGTDPALIEEANATQKQALIDNTNEAAALGAFGAPTFVVNGRHLYWGQDRFDQIEAELRGEWEPAV